MKKAVYRLVPLNCPSCIKKIENSLGKMDGVEEVKVMFHSNRVRVQFDEEMMPVEEIKNIIEKLGYPVLSQRVS